ncbi:hypothetical protein MRX96_026819 [Rhipicephalus microplus]
MKQMLQAMQQTGGDLSLHWVPSCIVIHWNTRTRRLIVPREMLPTPAPASPTSCTPRMAAVSSPPATCAIVIATLALQLESRRGGSLSEDYQD